MMHDRNIIAHGQCERVRRSDGFTAQRLCRICYLGPCRFGVGETEPPVFLIDTNRLHGAAINKRGEAI